MKPEEQQIAIAEACGWKELTDNGCFGVPVQATGYCPLLTVPDYINDLNAMHEAWKHLDRRQRIEFSQHLRNSVVNAGGHAASFNEDIVACVENATAAQRAEAFLRTIGKWVD